MKLYEIDRGESPLNRRCPACREPTFPSRSPRD
jgi:hypothetical protein